MNTKMMLILRHNAAPVIPVDVVAQEHFQLSVSAFIRKIRSGEILIPLILMEESQKCAKGVHIDDLSDYLDRRVEAARRDAKQYGYRGLAA